MGLCRFIFYVVIFSWTTFWKWFYEVSPKMVIDKRWEFIPLWKPMHGFSHLKTLAEIWRRTHSSAKIVFMASLLRIWSRSLMCSLTCATKIVALFLFKISYLKISMLKKNSQFHMINLKRWGISIDMYVWEFPIFFAFLFSIQCLFFFLFRWNN